MVIWHNWRHFSKCNTFSQFYFVLFCVLCFLFCFVFCFYTSTYPIRTTYRYNFAPLIHFFSKQVTTYIDAANSEARINLLYGSHILGTQQLKKKSITTLFCNKICQLYFYWYWVILNVLYISTLEKKKKKKNMK